MAFIDPHLQEMSMAYGAQLNLPLCLGTNRSTWGDEHLISPSFAEAVMYKKEAVAIGVMFPVADEHDGLVCMRHRRGMHVMPTVNLLNYCHYKRP
jgi:hypothetical protein